MFLTEIFVHDITAIKKALQLKDEFIKITGRELQTPLARADAYSEMLSNMPDSDVSAEAKAYIEKIREVITGMEMMILDLQDMQRLESGKVRFTFSSVEVDQVVANCVQSFSHLVPGVSIQRHGRVKRRMVVDQARLEQVLMNLLTNAVKYTVEPEKIIVSVAEAEDKISISVKDYGVGIPKEKQHLIFERFCRLNERSTVSGLGIGLYISNQIIKQLGGSITVASESGAGSVFTVTLPVA
jgi:signal transduction histidine kinase